MIVGIDLGTTFSLVSILPESGAPVVLPNALGERLTPSAVSVGDDGAMLVGAAARARALTHPERTRLAFKRDMGTDARYALADKVMSPVELSALVLSALRRDAEAALGEEVRRAVVTVPAYFGELQRQATRDAARLAGLTVERIVNEPTAAALVYGLHERDTVQRVAVLDLGGGTFDVTVLSIEDGEVQIEATSGDVRLGGDDFDAALSGWVLERGRADLGDALDPRAKSRIREACEQAKKRLSDAPSTKIALAGMPTVGGQAKDLEWTLSREEADAAWQPLLARLSGPVERALRDAGVSVTDIDEVLLVGGSTRMPCVSRFAADYFGRLPNRTLSPDHAVAMGAAVQAALIRGATAVSEMVVRDIAPFTLGVDSTKILGRHRVSGIFTPLIDRGTVLPVSRVRRFTTIDDLQTSITFEVFQGEHPLCKDNKRLGKYEVRGLKLRPAGEESVDVRFTYDENGLLEIDFEVVSTGRTETHLLESTSGKLSPEALALARKKLASLKVHPREDLPNATILARADAAYVELTGVARDDLGEAIATFRAALETEDAELIGAMRDRLIQLLGSEESLD